MVIIKNGRVVTAEAVLENHDVVVEDRRIAAVEPSSRDGRPPGCEIIDAAGGYVLPGFIDIHSDYIEHVAVPRPTSVMDLHLSLREAERELITHGVTTMYHSLALYDFSEFLPSPIRSPENTRKLIEVIEASHAEARLIRNRFHARFEVDNLGRIEELEGYIRSATVHLVSFMDHTPGQGQYRNMDVYRQTLKAYQGVADSEVERIIRRSQSRPKLTPEQIGSIVRLAREHSIAAASHDDDTLEKLATVKAAGVAISEFPTTLEVARQARADGLHTVAGAPNVLKGGSHSGNLSATDAVLDGSVDILCSDYYPAALLHAVFLLHRRWAVDLPAAVRLVTLNPAKAVLVDDTLGSLTPGKRADILVVDTLEDGFPVVTRALVDGRTVFESRYRGGAT